MQSVESAASAGARLLDEIDETSLEELLASLRTSLITTTTTITTDPSTTDNPNLPPPTNLRDFPLPRLNDIAHRHFHATHSVPLVLGGRYLELLYPLIATLIAAPHHKGVSILDFEGRFELLRLLATPPSSPDGANLSTARLRREDLAHVHILRPGPEGKGDAEYVKRCIERLEGYMLYGEHRSREREWWGTVVIGGGLGAVGVGGGSVAVVADRKGWLRVERGEVAGFEAGTSAERALRDRRERERAVDGVGWVGASPWGGVVLGRGGGR